ncbi:hypothetical protein LTR17_005381 [Elasticomyces elasticus]|nr:hypothetical protein LTR17_005381 [Elasticomyces elasticus]
MYVLSQPAGVGKGGIDKEARKEAGKEARKKAQKARLIELAEATRREKIDRAREIRAILYILSHLNFPGELRNGIYEMLLRPEIDRRVITDGFERIEPANTIQNSVYSKVWTEPTNLKILQAFGGDIGPEASRFYYLASTFVIYVPLTVAGISAACRWLEEVRRATNLPPNSLLKVRLMMGGCTWVRVPCVIPLVRLLFRSGLGCEVVEYNKMKAMRNTEQLRTLVVGMKSTDKLIIGVFEVLFYIAKRARAEGLSESTLNDRVNWYVKHLLDYGPGRTATKQYERAEDGVGFLWRKDRQGTERVVELPPPELQLPPPSPTLRSGHVSPTSNAVGAPANPTSPAKLYLFSGKADTITSVDVYRHWASGEKEQAAYFDARRHGFMFTFADFKWMARGKTVGKNMPIRNGTTSEDYNNLGYLLHCNGYVEPVTVKTSIKPKPPPACEALIARSSAGPLESCEAAYIFAQYNGFNGSVADFSRLARGCTVELGTRSAWYGTLSTAPHPFAGILVTKDGTKVPATFSCSYRDVDTVSNRIAKVIDVNIVEARDTIARAYSEGLSVQATYTANEAATWSYPRHYPGVTPASVSMYYPAPSFHRVQPPRNYFPLRLAIQGTNTNHALVAASPVLPFNPPNHFYQSGSVNPSMLAFGGTTINHSGFQNSVAGDSFTNPLNNVAATGDDAGYLGTPTPGSVMEGLEFGTNAFLNENMVGDLDFDMNDFINYDGF